MNNTSLGWKIFGLLISIGLIIGGLSGEMVLRGTESSGALVVAGVLFLIWDIYSIATHNRQNKETGEEEEDVSNEEEAEAEIAVANDEEAYRAVPHEKEEYHAVSNDEDEDDDIIGPPQPDTFEDAFEAELDVRRLPAGLYDEPNKNQIEAPKVSVPPPPPPPKAKPKPKPPVYDMPPVESRPTVFNSPVQTYYMLEHKIGSRYHHAGENQTISVERVEIGRAPECAVRFDEQFEIVSRRHAAIIKDGDDWKLVPVSQTNSTFVNGRRVHNEWYLQHNDEIQCAINGPVLVFKKT